MMNNEKNKGVILHKMQKFDSIQATTILKVPKTFGFIHGVSSGFQI